jgi:hypothetical protein
MRNYFFILFICLAPTLLRAQCVGFYGQTVRVDGIRPPVPAAPLRNRDRDVAAMLATLEGSGWQAWLPALDRAAAPLQLNPWYRYRFLLAAARVFYPGQPSEQAVFTGFCLAKSGYDVRFRYSQKKIAIYVYADMSLRAVADMRSFAFNVMNQKWGDKRYWSLYNLEGNDLMLPQLGEHGPSSKSRLAPNPGGKPFPFNIAPLPVFASASPVGRTWRWEENGLPKRLRFRVDSLSAVAGIYHASNHFLYRFNTPLSDTARKSLVLPLRQICQKLGPILGTEFLLGLVRRNITYRYDEIGEYIYGHDIVCTPEAALLRASGNCVDSASLFSYLVREVLGLPVVILVYRDHVNVAVALDGKFGYEPVKYKGRDYYICEPSDNDDTTPIGACYQKLGAYTILDLDTQ